MCNEGHVEYGRLHCVRGEYNKQPHGYPYLLSLAYRLFGVSESIAFRLNNAVAGLAVVVTVLLAQLLFGTTRASLLAGAVLALLPMQLTWSNTAAVEPSAALACAVAMLAATHYAATGTASAAAWMVAAAAWALTMRPECILIVPLVLFTVVLLAPSELATRRWWLAVAAGLVLAVVPLMHLAAVRDEGWGTTGPRLSWAYAQANAPVNFTFYFADERFPFAIAIAAIAGLAGRRHWRQGVLMAAYALAFWSIFVFFYAGSYNYGADVRYSLMSYVPIAIAAGVGFSRLSATLGGRGHRLRWVPTALVVAVFIGALRYAPVVRATGEEAWAARADVAAARQFAAMLPANSLVLTHNPSMFHVWGVNAAQLSIASDTAYVRDHLFARYAGGVYVHWNFWCNVSDPIQAAICRGVLDNFAHDRVADAHERDYTYAIYRLRR